jgi:hypothetical protein
MLSERRVAQLGLAGAVVVLVGSFAVLLARDSSPAAGVKAGVPAVAPAVSPVTPAVAGNGVSQPKPA